MNTMLTYLSHAFEGIGNTKVPSGITLVIYGDKGTSLTPNLVALACQINYENSHLPLNERLKYLKIVKRNTSTSQKVFEKNCADLIKHGDTLSKYRNSKDNTTYPFVFKQGQKISNFLLSETGGDGAVFALKHLLDMLYVPMPTVNFYRRNFSLNDVFKEAQEYQKSIGGKEIELHFFGCRNTTKQFIKSAMGIRSLHNNDCFAPGFKVFASKINNTHNASVAVSMWNTIIALQQGLGSIFRDIKISIEDDEGCSFMFLGTCLNKTLQHLMMFIKSGDIYKLSDSIKLENFSSLALDMAQLVDIFEDTLFDTQQDFTEKQFNPDTFKAIGLLGYIRALCLTYLGDFGYHRTKLLDQDLSRSLLRRMPMDIEEKIKSRDVQYRNKYIPHFDKGYIALNQNESVYYDVCAAVAEETDRLTDSNDDKALIKSRMILDESLQFKNSVQARTQNNGRILAINYLRHLYPIISKHRNFYGMGGTSSVKNILEKIKKHKITLNDISKGGTFLG